MSSVGPPAVLPAGRRSERIYRSLLMLYPRAFRREYGDDLVQAFGDLSTFAADGRSVWWRTIRDLASSATRERMSALSDGRRPTGRIMIIALMVLSAIVLAGPGPSLPFIFIPTLGFVVLPAYGLSRFREAWITRRSTGGPIARSVAVGVASLTPASAFVARYGSESAYYVVAAVALALIVGCGVGVIWAVTVIVSARRSNTVRGQSRRPMLILVLSVTILALIIGASFNSYRQSLGPPGDHSVENASAASQALWAAAGSGDVAEVTRLTQQTCADPWVKFPVGDGRHNVKGYAETSALVGSGNDDRLNEVAEILGDYMDVWDDRCGDAD